MPKLGEPLAVQRRLEFTLAPGLVEWTILCYLDLETRGPGLTGEQIHRVVDYKVKANPINQPKADRDPQASLYLAGRWLEGRRRVLVRADRQARTAAQTDERLARHHAANARAAALKPRPGGAGRVANRRPLPAFSRRSVRVRSVRRLRRRTSDPVAHDSGRLACATRLGVEGRRPQPVRPRTENRTEP